MSHSTFLDIDESLKTHNLLLIDKEEEDALNNKVDELVKHLESPSILVQPSPGVCVKTKTTDGEKVFINICVTDKIPPPEDIPDDILFQLMDDNKPAYTLPMSIGAERMEQDKSGAPCMTFDVMINTIYFKKCKEKKHFMTFTILVVLSGVAEKSSKQFDSDYVILKNRTVMGKLQQHRIQNREAKKPQSYKPLIEEIKQPKKSNIKKLFFSKQIDEPESGFIILKKEDPVESLIALFDMPKSVSIENVVVLINSDRINVTDEKACCSYDITLPYNVKTDNATAYLDYNLRVLRVNLLVK